MNRLNQLLFVELLKKKPFHGIKEVMVVKDLRAIRVEDWYVVCQDHKKWSDLCALAVDEATEHSIFLCNCERCFKRPGDIVVFVMCTAFH